MKSIAPKHVGLVATAILLIGAWHFLFWFYIAPTPLPSRNAALARSVRYIPVPDTGPGMGLASGQARAIWSPVLFALPSEAGFSKSILQTQSEISPPLDTPEDLSVLLARSDRMYSGSGPIVKPAALEALASRQVDQFPVVPAREAFPAIVPGEEPVVRILTQGGFTTAHFAELTLPEQLQQKNETSWQLVVDLEADALGFLVHAFVETSCGDLQLDQALVQTLYRKPLTGVTRPLRGKLIIQKNALQAQVKQGGE